jgi:hypothetical protein
VTAGPDHAERLLGRIRTVSGMVAAGLVVLALALIAVWGAASAAGAPGPGLPMLLGHAVAAAAAVALHRRSRRRSGRAGYLAALGPPAILLLVGVLFWWS